jgi:hypothetical protein
MKIRTIQTIVALVFAIACNKKAADSAPPAAASEQAPLPASAAAAPEPTAAAPANTTVTKQASSVAPALTAAPAATGEIPEVAANELRQAGISPSPTGLRALGANKASLLDSSLGLATRTAGLRAVLGSNTVVSALMARQEMKDTCKDTAVLERMLAYVLRSSTAQSIVSNPEAVVAVIESELFRRFRNCESFKKLEADSLTLKTLVGSDAAVFPVVTSANFVRGLEQAGIQQVKPTRKDLPRQTKSTDSGSTGGPQSLQKCCAALASNGNLAPSPNKERLLGAAAVCSASEKRGANKTATLAAIQGALGGAATLPASCR